jgi:hypothetical protein
MSPDFYISETDNPTCAAGYKKDTVTSRRGYKATPQKFNNPTWGHIMYMPSGLEVFCHQQIEQGASLEEIQETCRQRSAMLSQFMPETMDAVRERARVHDYCVRMREWYRNAPRF